MPTSSEISEQVRRESAWRARMGVPAFAGGFLYFLSAIIVTATLNSAPTVGLLQGLTPAIRGVANPPISPRAAEVKYISHHALALIAGSLVKSVALIVLMLLVLLLVEATRFRRPETWSAVRPLVLVGGVVLAVVNLVHQVVSSIQAHNFAVGHDFSSQAVEQALTKGAFNVGSQYVDLLAALALTAGIIVVSINAIRVGLLTRWLGVIGIFAGLLVFLPIGGATLEIIPAFWMAGMGVLYMGRWPNGDPPAWPSGEARPWPTQAERRAEREGDGGGGSGAGKPALASGVDSTPAPAPVGGGSRKRGRKRR
ncbi:MAG: hypothetical protein ACLQQB_12290 [Solirubrobacteraceae bacterium]|jgi:hypothetical protein